MDIVNSAMRTVKRSEIAAEFYSFPQKYVVGTDPDLEPINKWKATMSSLLEFTKGEGGDKPQLGQFAQQSMSPHNDQLKNVCRIICRRDRSNAGRSRVCNRQSKQCGSNQGKSRKS